MLSSRHRNQVEVPLSPLKKPRINSNKLPLDFFEHSCSLKVRRSQELGASKPGRDTDTPKFGRRRPSPLVVSRRIETALSKYENQEEEELIRDVIFSSRNIRRLRKFSDSFEAGLPKSERNDIVLTPLLPPLKNRKLFML